MRSINTEGSQYIGRAPWFSVQRGLRLRFRESHGLKHKMQGINIDDDNNQPIINELLFSQEVCSAVRVLELSEFTIRETVAL